MYRHRIGKKVKILKIAWATVIAVLLGFIFFVITDLVIISLGFAYNKTGNAVLDWLTLPQEIDRIYLVIYPLSILVYSNIFFKWINKDKEEAQVHWDIKTGVVCSIMAGIAFGGISTLWVMFLKNTALSNIGFIKSSLEYLNASSANKSTVSFIISLVVAGILAPINEEIIYRGVTFNFLEKRVNTKYALIVSSLMFGIIHLSFVQSVYATIMGLISGTVYMKTRKIRWSILIHITINTLAIYELTSNLIWVAFTIILFLPLGIMLYKLLKTKTNYAY